MIDFLVKDALSQTYGWTPERIDKMDSETVQAFLRIMSGRNKRQQLELRR